jgi:pyruvate/2-oxoglutarate dehydrogenase complex dihydrolipoamide dehydrogenase (E3) component
MNDRHYDLAVIGGGSGGLTAAIMGARLGARVILIDKTTLGGDCLHYGCVPSKALIATARLAHRMRHADRWGLTAHEPTIDIQAVMARIASIQARVGEHDSPEALAEHGVEVAFGGARFLTAHRLAIGGGNEIDAAFVVIATGSHAMAPPIPGLKEAGFLDHRDVFSLTELPARFVVIGGGPIGCELGQAFSRLGSAVTLVQRNARIVPREDPDVSSALLDAFVREGIDVRCAANPVRVERVDQERRVIVEQDGAEVVVASDAILVATGRRATIRSLDLDAAGVAFDERGITVNERLATNQAHIFAVGDCNGGPQFTHWAEHEARIATRNALFKGSSKRDASLLPRVTFTDPEVASVGLSLEQAKAEHSDAHVHVAPFDKVDRAQCESLAEGFLKLVVDKKDRILGAHAIGPEAGELLAEIVLAMEHGIDLTQVGSAIHAYPTMTRATRRVADERFFEHGLDSWAARLFANF